VYHDDVTPERMDELIRMLQAGDVPAPSRGEPMRDFRAASRLLAGLDPQQEVDA
jgi:NADH-quinone oxidoreductase subunit E